MTPTMADKFGPLLQHPLLRMFLATGRFGGHAKLRNWNILLRQRVSELKNSYRFDHGNKKQHLVVELGT